ncbi:hypothetical protein TSA1_13665 [Bradyrhizobium nitroreducens]|uniref:Uncharacterized protein n=1 Tax=Bradyrhizobium nitroreducens TaxID=709803 RepID=A0A2M6UAR2_9BRAD|nr:hypothetical protein [Bradyrhizobium nitroreducens]PIT01700.1 hypothetical protein TSA1_13665 [Bradyrhizobium nitroreducens]
MGNRTAKFVSALVGSLIAGAPLAAVSQNAPAGTSAASQAADCLASPKGTAPQGQHWYYRLDRTTKRQCWYLRAASDKDGAKATQTAQATVDASSDSPAQPPQQTVQDARAEYVGPRSTAAPRAPNAITSAAPANPTPPQQPASQADNNAPQAPATPAWPDVSAASPAPQPAPAIAVAAAQPNAKPSKSPAPLPPAATDGATDKPGVQLLLLVIGGALALAGILASVVYRFAGGRVRIQATDRRGHWNDWTPQDHEGSRAPWHEPALVPHAQVGPVDFDEVRPPQTAQLAAFTREISRLAAQSASVRSETTALEANELDEADIFNGEFEIEAAPPRLAARETDADKPVARKDDHGDQDMQFEDNVDVDVITAMLERLAQQGPQLPQPRPEAALANFARSQRGQSAARA